MVTDQSILLSINNIKFKKTQSIFNRLSLEEQQYILNRYNDSLSIKETIYRLKNNIEIRPVCKHCGSPVEFCRNGYFRDFCCNKCINLSAQTKEKRKINSLHKYGCESPMQSKEFIEKVKNTWKNKSEEELQLFKYQKSIMQKSFSKEKRQEIIKKIKQTKFERYGDENYCNYEKSNITKLERYGYYFNIDKYKNTCLEKYGVDHPTKSNEVKEKIKNTCLEKYGVDHPTKSNEVKEKIKNTNFKKYGVKYASQLNEIKEKQKQTCFKRYGVTTFFKSNKLKEACHSEKANIKRNETIKQNYKLYKFSKQENICYDLLCNKFKTVIRQYRSDKYPFNCDFYIPELELYIEYNGSQYHHYHAFNENNDIDKNELKRLNSLAENSKRHKEGKKSQYDVIIYTWTDLDPRKRNTAKENKLNFVEFWNINEVKEWINNLIY